MLSFSGNLKVPLLETGLLQTVPIVPQEFRKAYGFPGAGICGAVPYA